ncbi:MAG: glycosyltransferase, partial [Bacteroidota bacterium]
MGKHIAILLNGEIRNDYRVLKVIQTLSREHCVDLFYVNGVKIEDQKIFNRNVELFPLTHKAGILVKLLRHTMFCYEFNFLGKAVLSTYKTYDVIWCNDLPTLYPAWKLSKSTGAKLVYDSHEIYVETLNQFFPRQTSGIKKWIFQCLLKFMRRHGERIESRILPEVDDLITVNESLREFFQLKYRINSGHVIMNLPNKLEPKCDINFRSIYNWKETDIILLYQGMLNEGRGLNFLCDTMLLLPDQYKLVFVGDGPLLFSLKTEVKQKSLEERIKFTGLVPLNELPCYTKGANMGINLLEDLNLSKKYASPNKLFEYIHAEIPVLGSFSPENEKVLENYNIGCLSENDPQ